MLHESKIKSRIFAAGITTALLLLVYIIPVFGYGNVITVATSGGDYTTISGAVGSIGSDGYTIQVYPGTYDAVSVDLDYQMSFVGMGATYDDVIIRDDGSTDTELFEINDDDIRFRNLTLFSRQTASILDNSSNKNYTFYECTIRCSTFTMGAGDAFFDNCVLLPTNDDWLVSGSGANAQLRHCRFANDIPLIGGFYGMRVEDDAVLSMFYCDGLSVLASTNYTPMFQVDSSKVLSYFGRFICDNGPVFKATSAGILAIHHNFFENSEDSYPAIHLQDESYAQIVQSFIKAQGSDIAIKIESSADSYLYNNVLKGCLWLDETTSTITPNTDGKTFVYGSNAVRLYDFGDTPYDPIEDDHDLGRGGAFGATVYGKDNFVDYATSVQITVPGMPVDAIVTITLDKGSAVESNDAIHAVEVSSGSFTVYRGSTTNTEDLGFFWVAKWDAHADDE